MCPCAHNIASMRASNHTSHTRRRRKHRHYDTAIHDNFINLISLIMTICDMRYMQPSNHRPENHFKLAFPAAHSPGKCCFAVYNGIFIPFIPKIPTECECQMHMCLAQKQFDCPSKRSPNTIYNSSEGAYTFPHSKHYTIDDIIRLCVSHYSSGLRASIPANSIVQNESVFVSLMPHRTPINTAFMPITFRCEITSHRFQYNSVRRASSLFLSKCWLDLNIWAVCAFSRRVCRLRPIL